MLEKALTFSIYCALPAPQAGTVAPAGERFCAPGFALLCVEP